ncbi:hypothetical protein LCGC14_1105680 [marine sediment metagenome]|uniref:Uncharacterized protein n=1 Tax=marine sediment metagenome TaxID=412755 RepID=A0A0F9M867_9ZZZZ
MAKDSPTITLGGKELSTPQAKIKRFSCLIWGSSGGGKTTLAATAPGKKLWINFDPDGTDAIAYRDDIILNDFSTEPNACVEKFKEDDPLRITQFLADHKEIETVVFDSLTTFGDRALTHGVVKAAGTPKGKYATIEDPGYSGYGRKNTWTRLCVKNLLKATGRVDRNMIFIAHEDKPVTNTQGEILFISIMLGSSLNEQIPVDLSEIWNLSDTGRERRIAVRNCRLRKPLKSRMFITSGAPEFIWKYNADSDEGPGIADWIEEWKQNSGKKIPLPV